MTKFWSIVLAPVFAALAAGIDAPNAGAFPPYARTVLVSRTARDMHPNGASRHAVISQDKRFGRVVAFESDATDIAPGAAPGVTNVYAAYRQAPFADNGTLWSF